MPVHFTCPHCGQLLSVTRRKVGHPVQCVRCQGGVLVPPPSEFEQQQEPKQSESYQPDAALDNDLAPHSMPYTSGTVELTRTAIYTVGGLIAGVAIVAFLLGWSFGSELSGQKQVSSQPSTRRVSGRIAYLTNRGKTAPDSEAVVVAFPTNRKPDEKFDPIAMRPDVAPANVPASLLSAVRTLGGDFRRTDRNGTYQLELSNPGEYFILIISNHHSRGNRQPSTLEVVEIGQFVPLATELLKNNDYVWAKHIVAKPLMLDHVFTDE